MPKAAQAARQPGHGFAWLPKTGCNLVVGLSQGFFHTERTPPPGIPVWVEMLEHSGKQNLHIPGAEMRGKPLNHLDCKVQLK